jgi:hypothetical protein
MLMMGRQQSTKPSPVNFKRGSLSINVLDPMFLPIITTESYAVRKQEVGWKHRQNLKGSKTNITKHYCLQTVEAESAGVSPPTDVGH